MTSVLHPVGPEPEQTYWARRLAVLVALVVAVGLVIAVIVNGTSNGSAVSASPPAAGVPPVVSPTPTPSGSTSTAASPSATASPSAKESATARPTPAKPTPAKPTPAKPTPTGPVACAPAKLRGTLTGKQTLKPGQDATFTLSLINGSDRTCVVSVTPVNFELKIYSGTDRIWSTDDCPAAVRMLSRKVEAEGAVEWQLRWDGRRSRTDCRNRPETPRPGTYVATAQLDGAEPVQLRVLLHD
jgi:hypothetical protein